VDTTGGWHGDPVDSVLQSLETQASGLSRDGARERLATLGPNVLPRVEPRRPLEMLLGQAKDTISLVLLGAGILAFATNRPLDGCVVVAVVVVNMVIGAAQEAQAQHAIEAISHLVPDRVVVRREGQILPIPATELVPGDIALLGAGDNVPADMRVLSARDLRVNEATLTGESLPATKHEQPVAKSAPLGDRRSMLYSGTMVVSGTGAAIVVGTGHKTELGRISSLVEQATVVETPLTHTLREFCEVLTIVIGILAAVVLGVALMREYPAGTAVRAAVAFVVAAVPAELPAVITAALAVGVRRMAKRNAIVRTLPAVETLGSTNVVCSDKTGTLTRGEMMARALWTAHGFYQLTGTGYDPRGSLEHNGLRVHPPLPDDVRGLLTACALCSDANIHREEGGWATVGDPTEIALLVAATKLGLDVARLRSKLTRFDEVPFDSGRKYMMTAHRDTRDGKRLVIMKGAPRVVLERCDQMASGGSLDVELVMSHVEELASHSMRVLGVAWSVGREMPARPFDSGCLGLLGLVASADPPRPEAIEAIAQCRRSGVRVVMMTGDHPSTAKAVAADLGIAHPDRVVTGSDMDAMDNGKLADVAGFATVFSRMAPEHKLRLVKVLQSRGKVVAMTGDGVNDAPALKQADIGIAMGIGGTAAAKEAADVVLADDNFASIAAGIEGGRCCYENLVKVLLFVAPVDLGLALVLLVGVLVFPVVDGIPVLPILPLQILWVNLVTGITLAVPLAFEVDERDLMSRPPRPRNQQIFTGQLALRSLVIGARMIAGSILLFIESYYGRTSGPGASAPPEDALRHAQTMAATTMVLFQVFYMWQCRSLRSSTLTSNPFTNPSVFLGIGVVLLLQVLFVYLPGMHSIFDSAPLGLRDWLAAVAVGASLGPVVGLQKWAFARHAARDGR